MSCCAVGCQNRNSVNSDLKFYRIPSDNNSFNANRRRRWLQAIRRSDWNKDLIKNARLCSSHFISGEVSMDFNSPDFVPSVFSFATQCEIDKGDTKLERFKRKRKREETIHRPPDDVQRSKEASDEASGACLSSDDCRVEPGADQCTEATVPKVLHDDLKHKYSQLSTECVNLRLEIDKLKTENEELKATLMNTQFSFSSIKSKAVQVLFFTGLTSVLFEWLSHKLKNSVEVVRGSMNLKDHLLIVLMKLRLGLCNKDIAFRFNVTESDISNILRSWLPVMSATLKPLIKWPSKHAVLKNMPKCFKPKYKHCRCIIDYRNFYQ
ncbi:uncharacterized protein LOC132449708 isoform X1 [Gadus macrocephalus]|uniref:uncharacterized protein LOC132449708 isoform X1 n=1 Tax=Gadus macrocephalus TaxID=80720 RepID=UPI0028CB94F5|nr:uncharacterized protein LOC132449708 isoform X1 [Gadus macrocephalus]